MQTADQISEYEVPLFVIREGASGVHTRQAPPKADSATCVSREKIS